MASTYVNDLRLNEMATGDGSGTWGTTTNTNLELIAEAFSYGTEGITTNADTHTSTIADGATDPVRSMYVKYTGTLDSACTITIAPNTICRMQFIENATSGSQNIIISQGSGANVTIPAGDVKAVYLDGAGSGAAVVDAFASLSVVDLKVQDDLTVTDDLIVNGDIDLEGSIDVNGTANLDVVDIDGAVDMASTLQVDGAITSSAGATITLADNTDNLTLTSTDADAAVGPNLRMYRNSGSPADDDYIGEIQFEGRNDNSQDVIYAGLATRIVDASDGTEDGRFELYTITAGAQNSRVLANSTETVINEDSVDLDFRVEGNGIADLLFVDAGNDRVGIGAGSPSTLLTITDNDDGAMNEMIRLVNDPGSSTSTGTGAYIAFANHHSGTEVSSIRSIAETTGAGTGLQFYTHSGSALAEKVRIDKDGKVGIGTASPSYNTHIQSTASETTLAIQSNLSPTGSSVGGRLRLQLGAQNNSGSGQADTSAGDTCGQILFEGQGTDYAYQAGHVKSLVTTGDGTATRTEQGAALTFGTMAVGATSQVEVMRLTEAGRLGIGVTSPDHKLEVSDGAVASKYDANHHVAIRGLSGGQYIQMSSENPLSFVQVDTYPNSGATEIVRMQSSGFSIGSGSIASHGDQMLRVVGDKNGYAMYLNNSRSTINQPQGLLIDTSAVSSDNNSQVFMKCDDSSAARMQVFTDGDVWTSDAGTLSSDETLKKNIADATDKLSDVMNLKVRNFKWKTSYHPVKQHKHIGFIAQEFETVFPALIVENNIARHDEEPNMKKGIKQGGLIPILVKCVQELSAKNDALEARIKTLEDA